MEIVKGICNTIAQRGGRAYLIGGAVRDMILGRSEETKDFDIEVFNLPEHTVKELLENFGLQVEMVGATFGVFKVKGHNIDVSLPRTENRTGNLHTDFNIVVDPSLSLTRAAERRDFTINAVSFDPLTGEYHDPFHGRADLEHKILRAISPTTFVDDPLRVLRGMQFIARFGLIPHPDTVALCRTLSPLYLSKERVFEEWNKFLLKGQYMTRGLGFLNSTGWIQYYPELYNLVGCPQEYDWHPEGDVYIHTGLALDTFAKTRWKLGEDHERLIVGYAVLLHDIAKPYHTEFSEGAIRSLEHDSTGEGMAKHFMEKYMTNQEKMIEQISLLVGAHMQVGSMHKSGCGMSAIRRLAMRVGRLDLLSHVIDCDHNGKGKPYEIHAPALWLGKKAVELNILNSKPKPLIQGKHLIDTFQFPPGKKMGECLKLLFEFQLDGRFSTVEDGLRQFAPVIITFKAIKE